MQVCNKFILFRLRFSHSGWFQRHWHLQEIVFDHLVWSVEVCRYDLHLRIICFYLVAFTEAWRNGAEDCRIPWPFSHSWTSVRHCTTDSVWCHETKFFCELLLVGWTWHETPIRITVYAKRYSSQLNCKSVVIMLFCYYTSMEFPSTF